MSQSWVKAILALLYKRTSKDRRKGKPPTPNNLSLYTLHLLPSNHSSCSDVSSESPTTILHTTSTTVISTTMPHHPTSQHLRPLTYQNTLSHHIPPTPSCHSHVSQRLCLSVTLICLVPLNLSLVIRIVTLAASGRRSVLG